MNGDGIKQIRGQLDLSQEQFAAVLSVTQATVARWENEKNEAATPTGSAIFRLRQLAVTLARPADRQMLMDILAEPGGPTTLAALLTLGGSFGKATESMGIPSLFGPSGVATSASALTALRVLNKIVNKQIGVKRMSELPLRESDADLVPLLRNCKDEDIDPLVQYILQKGWLTSELEQTEVYKKNQPHHHVYADEISSEIQRFGGHTWGNMFRGGEGVPYKSIVCDVAKRFKVNFNENREIEVIEQQILLSILEKAWEKMTDEEKAQLLKESGAKAGKVGAEFPLAAFLAIFKAGGFKSYVIMYTAASAVSRFVIGRGLLPLTNAALGRWAAVLTGPIGWAITAVWTLFDLGSPAYRVTIPCVIHIAMLRQLITLRENGQDPATHLHETASGPESTAPGGAAIRCDHCQCMYQLNDKTCPHCGQVYGDEADNGRSKGKAAEH